MARIHLRSRSKSVYDGLCGYMAVSVSILAAMRTRHEEKVKQKTSEFLKDVNPKPYTASHPSKDM